MNKKQKFMKAVRTLAPDDQFIVDAAQRIPEEKLTTCPGAAALEFVVGLSRLRGCLTIRPHQQRARRKKPEDEEAGRTQAVIVAKTAGEDLVEKAVPIPYPITLEDIVRVKSAEYWLEHGQPDEALRELEKLLRKATGHPWALRTHQAVVDALRELNGQTRAE